MPEKRDQGIGLNVSVNKRIAAVFIDSLRVTWRDRMVMAEGRLSGVGALWDCVPAWPWQKAI